MWPAVVNAHNDGFSVRKIGNADHAIEPDSPDRACHFRIIEDLIVGRTFVDAWGLLGIPGGLPIDRIVLEPIRRWRTGRQSGWNGAKDKGNDDRECYAFHFIMVLAGLNVYQT